MASHSTFRAGGVVMQTDTGTPVDIVLVVQSLIVLFIAAPALTRRIFMIRDSKRTPKKPSVAKAVAAEPAKAPAEAPAEGATR